MVMKIVITLLIMIYKTCQKCPNNMKIGPNLTKLAKQAKFGASRVNKPIILLSDPRASTIVLAIDVLFICQLCNNNTVGI